MRRAVKALFAAVVVAGVVLLFVFPVRTLIDQRDQTSTAERQLRGLTAENEQLSNTAAQLQSPAAIQQIARQQYGLVKPGEKAYGIVPPPATTAANHDDACADHDDHRAAHDDAIHHQADDPLASWR